VSIGAPVAATTVAATSTFSAIRLSTLPAGTRASQRTPIGMLVVAR
jgi:hypothetical protein